MTIQSSKAFRIIRFQMTARAQASPYSLGFFVVLLFGTGVLCLVVLRPFLTAIAWSVILAVALWPLWRRLKRRLPKRTTFAAAAFSICAGLVVLLPSVLLGTAIVTQASRAVTAFAEKLRARELRSFADVISVPGVGKAITWLELHTGLSSDELQAKGAEFATRASTFLAAKSGDVVLSFLYGVLTFVLTLFLLFFLLVDGESMAEAISDLLPIEDAERHRIIQSLGGMMESIFKGSLVCAVVQGASGGIAWAIAGFPSVILAGVAMGILSLLPIGGTAIVWLPGLIVLFVQGRTGIAIFFLLWNLTMTSTFADNFLKPLLIGRKDTELSTLMVFLGVFGGLPAFGLLGVFIGPIALAVGLMLVRVLRSLARDARVSAAA
jgi:predicted PurR-regulated permease PerM